MEIVAFQMKHLRGIEIREWDRKLVSMIDPIPMIQAGPAFSLIIKEKVVIIGGVAILWPGVGEAWVISSPLVTTYPLALTRSVKRYLGLIEKAKHLHRVQAVVLVDHPTGHRWIRGLGFKCEGMMIAYGPNKEDFMRYAKVR
jgi:hypothetical protein